MDIDLVFNKLFLLLRKNTELPKIILFYQQTNLAVFANLLDTHKQHAIYIDNLYDKFNKNISIYDPNNHSETWLFC